jgi:hypothetical protein
VGREGAFFLLKLFPPAFAAATGGEGERQQAVMGIANNNIANRKKAADLVKPIIKQINFPFINPRGT